MVKTRVTFKDNSVALVFFSPTMLESNDDVERCRALFPVDKVKQERI